MRKLHLHRGQANQGMLEAGAAVLRGHSAVPRGVAGEPRAAVATPRLLLTVIKRAWSNEPVGGMSGRRDAARFPRARSLGAALSPANPTRPARPEPSLDSIKVICERLDQCPSLPTR